MTTERNGVVTFQGGPLTLVGPEVKGGDKAPDADLLNGALQPTKLSSTSGKVRVISVVPSLDTPVCDAQTRKFNEEAAKLNGVDVYTISTDNPFAQQRFCGAAGIKDATVLSDYYATSFGLNWGLLIKEWRMLARSVWVVGKDDTIKYGEIVREQSQHPDYEKALEAVKRESM